MKLKIGIFSGTFDPIHLGHINLAKQAKAKFGLDEVFFIPEKIPRKKDNVTNYTDRLEMIKLAIDPNGKVIDYPKNEHDYRLIEYLKDKFPAEYYLIVGSDVAVGMENWQNFDRIKAELSGIIVVTRPSHENQDSIRLPLFSNLVFEHPASSKKIRHQISDDTVRANLDPKVLKYIDEHGLYH